MSWALALLLLASAVRAQPPIGENADLGAQGNAYVARTFEAYRAAHPGGACRAGGGGARVIVTGYGLFSGVDYNVSGTVARSMAEPAFWPDRAPGAAPIAGKLESSQHGGAAFNRSVTIDGRRYEVCFLLLDVIWDLAAGILVHEESRFKPRLVVMTGRGGGDVSVEAGAFNRASAYPGYDADGRPMGRENTPESEWLLPDYAVDHELPMTWDNQALARAIGPMAEALGYSVSAPRAARGGNNYLCNDISFVALHAAKNRPTRLAADRVFLPPAGLENEPVTGFLHFPTVDYSHADLSRYGDGIFEWANVVARVIALSAPGGRVPAALPLPSRLDWD